jgi:hypothetical protein
MPRKFKFYKPDEQTAHFQCTLQGERCHETGRNGHQCKNRTVIGLPYCWVHLLTIKHLRLLPSTIPDAGKGLFAMKRKGAANEILFRKDDKIIEYYGERITQAELDERYGDYTAPYAIDIGDDNDYEDAACQRGIGAMANHAPKARSNAELQVEQVTPAKNTWRVILRATKNIANNREIFVNYGTNYLFNDGSTYRTTK